MSHYAIDNLLLFAANEEMHRVWGRFDHQRPADGWSQMLIVGAMAAVAAAALVAWLFLSRRPQRHFTSQSNAKLFRELCSAHRLGYSSRRFLKQVAAAHGLSTPTLLFVEPKYFDVANLPADLQPVATDLRRLRMQLFD